MANFCPSIADGFSSWPDTPAGTAAVVPCPSLASYMEAYVAEYAAASELAERPDGFQLQLPQSTANATKLCMENATWHPVANYELCAAEALIVVNATDDAWGHHVSAVNEKIDVTILAGTIYLTGAILSVASIIAALSIFFTFRRLRCLRNYIHAQLLVSLLIKYTVWFIIYGREYYSRGRTPLCEAIGVMFVYVSICQFTWMFLEALNIVITIVRALAPGTNTLKPWLLVGWGAPVPVVLVWAAFNKFNPGYKPSICWLPHFVRNYHYGGDLIYAIPIFLLVVANFVLMGFIIWILITKLRRAANSQVKPLTSCTRQTVKATLVLVPLLGINHVLWTYPPDDLFTLNSRILVCTNVALQSMQGFWVSLCYCFLNGEVKCTLTANIRRLKDSWTVQSSVNDQSKSHPKFRSTVAQPANGNAAPGLVCVLLPPSETYSSTC